MLYDSCGKISKPNGGLDLMLAPVKHEGWAHVYKRNNGRKPVVGRAIFATKEEALAAAKQHKTEDRIIDTIHIEWEE